MMPVKKHIRLWTLLLFNMTSKSTYLEICRRDKIYAFIILFDLGNLTI